MSDTERMASALERIAAALEARYGTPAPIMPAEPPHPVAQAAYAPPAHPGAPCAEHPGQEWRGEPGDLWHLTDELQPNGRKRVHRHPSNVRRRA